MLNLSVCLQSQVSPFLQQVFMPLVLAIFEVLARPAEDNDQAAALEKQMLRRSYFSFIQTIAGSGMNEVMANQGEFMLWLLSFIICVWCGAGVWGLLFHQEQKTLSESCSPSSKEPWTFLTPSLRKPVSSSSQNWSSCGVRISVSPTFPSISL